MMSAFVVLEKQPAQRVQQHREREVHAHEVARKERPQVEIFYRRVPEDHLRIIPADMSEKEKTAVDGKRYSKCSSQDGMFPQDPLEDEKHSGKNRFLVLAPRILISEETPATRRAGAALNFKRRTVVTEILPKTRKCVFLQPACQNRERLSLRRVQARSAVHSDIDRVP
jgi:hypothetical protein